MGLQVSSTLVWCDHVGYATIEDCNPSPGPVRAGSKGSAQPQRLIRASRSSSNLAAEPRPLTRKASAQLTAWTQLGMSYSS
eukprot:CAMPEP_0171090354 /NCGR_PEP_ID=MMETSP0766_2-20121228/30530_1 /TAXON_ID=439317 /ORGANISM="Gambierdiscus australes, Strain CAWD 149" /LENGTH=80 /DNA_ID=CAMNT_0011548335 /DNA_START=52 /DNA_END=294 /DNA_ORIENTATION=+